jgi:hypothetical protein
MSNDATPANVGSNAGLGPLPGALQPVAYLYHDATP